jgi:hypothetical protein
MLHLELRDEATSSKIVFSQMKQNNNLRVMS